MSKSNAKSATGWVWFSKPTTQTENGVRFGGNRSILPGPWYGTPTGTPDPPPQSPEPTSAEEPEATSEDLGRIAAEDIQAMKGKVSSLQSVGADDLAYDQLKTISRIFKVSLSIINQFRWGKAMAPVGHPHHKTIYFTIEYGDDTFAAREMIRIDSDGNVTERTKE